MTTTATISTIPTTCYHQRLPRQLNFKEGIVKHGFRPFGTAGRDRNSVPHPDVLAAETHKEDAFPAGYVKPEIFNGFDARLQVGLGQWGRL